MDASSSTSSLLGVGHGVCDIRHIGLAIFNLVTGQPHPTRHVCKHCSRTVDYCRQGYFFGSMQGLEYAQCTPTGNMDLDMNMNMNMNMKNVFVGEQQ